MNNILHLLYTKMPAATLSTSTKPMIEWDVFFYHVKVKLKKKNVYKEKYSLTVIRSRQNLNLAFLQ